MGKKIYVGNLSFSVDSQQLTDVFSEFGNVSSVNVITDRDTGRSKGFAFVEMMTENEAQTAIQKLDGADFAGRPLRISEAKPQENRTSGGGDNRRSGGGGFGSRRSF